MRFRVAFLVAVVLVCAVAAAPPAPSSSRATSSLAAAALPTGNATLELRVAPASASVLVNGTSVPLAANGSAELHLAAGTYGVSATAAGHRSFSGNVSLRPGQVVFLTLPLPDNPTSAPSAGGPSGSLWLAIALTIVGAVAVVGLVVYLRRAPTSGRRPANASASADTASTEAADRDEGPD